MKLLKYFVPLCLLVALAFAGVYWFYTPSTKQAQPVVKKVETAKKQPQRQKVVKKAKKPGRTSEGTTVVKIEEGRKASGHSAPARVYDEDQLSREMRAVYDQIVAAMEDDTPRARKDLTSLATKMLAEMKAGKIIPPVVRSKMVEALSLGTPQTLPELIGFLNDSDPEVAEAAQSGFQDVLLDTTLSDKEMAGYIKALSAGSFDSDTEDAIFSYIESDMRNSVAVDTYVTILQNGSDEMKRRAGTSIGEFLSKFTDYAEGDDAVNTPEQLQEWLSNHPDDEDDADFYKGVDD